MKSSVVVPKKKKEIVETVEKEKKEQKRSRTKRGKTEIYVQYGEQELSMEIILEKVKNAYIAEGHEFLKEDDVRVYIKPQENMIYYVVNNSYASGINLFDLWNTK